MIIRKCSMCGNGFLVYPSIRKKTCSQKCYKDFIKKRKKERYENFKKVCKVCGIEFLPPRPLEGGTYCSYKCSGVAVTLERVDREGYWYIRVKGHPATNKAGYVPEHNIIMEKSIGRYLFIGEVVHHKDEDRKNNDLSNLELMTDKEHKSLHMKLNHKRGVICSQGQKARASIRMKKNNPNSRAKRSKGVRHD